jgi:hypothetical protein
LDGVNLISHGLVFAGAITVYLQGSLPPTQAMEAWPFSLPRLMLALTREEAVRTAEMSEKRMLDVWCWFVGKVGWKVRVDECVDEGLGSRRLRSFYTYNVYTRVHHSGRKSISNTGIVELPSPPGCVVTA